jgi:hypothetical protein
MVKCKNVKSQKSKVKSQKFVYICYILLLNLARIATFVLFIYSEKGVPSREDTFLSWHLKWP